MVEHSDFRHDLWRRLLRTLRALYLIVYGTKGEAEQVGAVVQAVHARVHGVTRERLGRFPAGTAYSASSPELMLWVHATLVHASLGAYQRFAAKLTAHEEESYYQQMATVARIFGTAAAVLPRTLTEFRDYFDAQVEEGDICVTPPAREIASVIHDAPYRRRCGYSRRRTGLRRRRCCRPRSATHTGCAGARSTSSRSPSPPARSTSARSPPSGSPPASPRRRGRSLPRRLDETIGGT